MVDEQNYFRLISCRRKRKGIMPCVITRREAESVREKWAKWRTRSLRRERSFSEKFHRKWSIRKLEKGSPSVSPLVWEEVIACGIDFLRGPPQCPLSIIRYQRLLELDVNDVEALYDLGPWTYSKSLDKCFPFPKDAGSIHLSLLCRRPIYQILSNYLQIVKMR